MSTTRAIVLMAGTRPIRLLPILLLTLGLLAVGTTPALAASTPRVDVVDVDGTITPVMAGYIERAIDRAGRDGATALVLRVDTPGGLSSAMDDIIDDILRSRVPVVVYVSPAGSRAASAGVYITYAAHVAAMAPGTRIGSASPIFLSGDGTASDGNETLARKVTNDAVSQIKNLATLRGRNAEWGERAVRDAVNVTADEASALGVIDLIAPDLPTLLDQIDGRTVRLETGTVTLQTRGAAIDTRGMGWAEQFLQLLADPTIAYILLSLGSLGLFLELSNPGAILPGVVGGLFLLLALYSLGTIPVNWTGVLLIGFAFLLFAVDLVVPSFGSLTIGGVISFVLGSYLLVRDSPPGYDLATSVIWTITALLVGFFLFLGAAVLRARLRRPTTGREGLVGRPGTVRRTLAPEGTVFAAGELWQATVDGAELPVGSAVIITGIEGVRLRVRAATVAEATELSAHRRVDTRTVVPVVATRARTM